MKPDEIGFSVLESEVTLFSLNIHLFKQSVSNNSTNFSHGEDKMKDDFPE